MRPEFENVLPMDIEKRSFEIISEELKKEGLCLDDKLAPIIKRVIHTTADFDYAKNLAFSDNVLDQAIEAIREGACIVTDTRMAWSGINKKALAKFGGEVYNFMADEDVAQMAKEQGTTRACACMDKAAKMDKPLIFAIGNAPTALIRLYDLIQEGRIAPKLIIGVPVGFVNVVQAKELIMEANVP